MNNQQQEMRAVYCASPADGAVSAVCVLPEYQHYPEYVGVLQWCTGPELMCLLGEKPSLVFSLKPTFYSRGQKGIEYYFKIFKHDLSLYDCTKRVGDAAILAAFTALCNDSKVQMAFDTPFAADLANDAARQTLIDTITEQFYHLYQEINN